MNKKRILFIIESYPHFKSANVRCDEKIISELQKRGEYEIHCLTYQYSNQPLEEEINGLFVHRFRKGLFWQLYTWAQFHEDTTISRVIIRFKKISLRIRQFLLIPFYPYYDPIDTFQFCYAAAKAQRKYGYDIVFAEHLGINCLCAAKTIKKKNTDVKTIAVFWDPMYGKNGAKYLPSSYTEYKSLKTQERLMRYFDRIVQMDSAKDFFERNKEKVAFLDKVSFFSIPGIIKPIVSSNSMNYPDYYDSNKINILYTGLLTNDRNPIPFLKLIEKTSTPNKFNFVFLSSGIGFDNLLRFKEKSSLSIHVFGYVGAEILASYMANADCYLNLGGEQLNMVPSKIFEYMSYGKPIISCFRTNDASLIYFAKYPNACLIDIDEKDTFQNIARIERFVANLSSKVDFDYLLETFPNNTPGVYCELIDSLCK